jgi:hypothetical protein
VLPPNAPANAALFSTRVTSVQVEIPLLVTAATSADALQLELRADQQQWCLRAMDSHSARPTGPPSATGDAWAMRWTQLGSPSVVGSSPATLTVWVGGPHYVTARAEASVTTAP